MCPCCFICRLEKQYFYTKDESMEERINRSNSADSHTEYGRNISSKTLFYMLYWINHIKV